MGSLAYREDLEEEENSAFTWEVKANSRAFNSQFKTSFLCWQRQKYKGFPEISTLPWFTLFAPLVCLLTIRATRDLVDDIERQDHQQQALPDPGGEEIPVEEMGEPVRGRPGLSAQRQHRPCRPALAGQHGAQQSVLRGDCRHRWGDQLEVQAGPAGHPPRADQYKEHGFLPRSGAGDTYCVTVAERSSPTTF